MAENNLTIEGRLPKNFPDIQRNWTWILAIPGIRGVAPQSAIKNEEDLIVRCRSFSIPPRGLNVNTSEFLGFKQHFPGRPNVDGTVTASFQETEDQRITQIFYEWNQMLFNVNPANPVSAGKSKFPYKRLGTRDIFLMMHGYNGVALPKAIRFANAFPNQVSEVALDYSSGGDVVYSVTFQYDFWTLFPDTTI